MTYTQTEVLRLKEELRTAKEQEQSIRTLQQRQLDSVQVQLREMDQRLSEVVDAVTELFNKQKSIHDLLGRLLHDFDALKGQTQQTIPATMIPHTQPYCTTCLPLERSLQQYRVQHCFSDELPTCLYVPQTVLSDQVTCAEFSAMCDMSIEIDRVLSFLTTRRHLLFFYSYSQGYPTEPVETMLRRHGNDMVYELEMFMHGCYERGVIFLLWCIPILFKDPQLLPQWRMMHLHSHMCCALPVFAEAGSSPLPEQSAIGFMLTLNVFYKLHGFVMTRWNGSTYQTKIAFASGHG